MDGLAIAVYDIAAVNNKRWSFCSYNPSNSFAIKIWKQSKKESLTSTLPLKLNEISIWSLTIKSAAVQ